MENKIRGVDGKFKPTEEETNKKKTPPSERYLREKDRELVKGVFN